MVDSGLKYVLCRSFKLYYKRTIGIIDLYDVYVFSGYIDTIPIIILLNH